MTEFASWVFGVITGIGWVGLVLFLFWQEFFAEQHRISSVTLWFRIPATIVFGLVILVFALECMQQEMTVRRWATSVVVFGVFGVLFLAFGIFDPEELSLSRWVLLPVGVYYLLAAILAGAGAKDVL